METNFTEMDRIVTVMKFYSATRTWVPFEFIAEHSKRDRASLASVLDEMLRLGMIDSHEIRSNGRTAVYYCLDQHRESPRDVESRIFFHGRHQEKRRVRISDVTVHECLQQRNRVVNADAVARYVLDMEKGSVFPPVELYQMPGGRLILVDGYHRLQAAKRCDEQRIDAVVTQGTFAEAVGRACSANTNRGLRRTWKDNRRSLIAFFANPLYRKATAEQAARVVGCTPGHSRNVRNALIRDGFLAGRDHRTPVVFTNDEYRYIDRLMNRKTEGAM